jgi:WD40 repeat protein
VPKLRLLAGGPGIKGHQGEVFACAFTPDGNFVLSAGWDGHLRLWEVSSGQPVGGLRAGSKPLSACTVSPGGKYWLSGSLDGVLSVWDAAAGQCVKTYVAHTRPISMMLFGDEPTTLITASWDRHILRWNLERDRESQPIGEHEDCVAGCRLLPDGNRLVSWAHDGTVAVWSLETLERLALLKGHADRVSAAAVSPDGCWIASGSRDGHVVLWDREKGQKAGGTRIHGDVRGCLFLLDGQSLLVIDETGRVSLWQLPQLVETSVLDLAAPVYCAELDPTGSIVAVGTGEGQVCLVAVDGFDQAPLIVTPTRTSRRTATALQRLFGSSTLKRTYQCTCPVCRNTFELPQAAPGLPAGCPHCRRRLRLGALTRVGPEEEA